MSQWYGFLWCEQWQRVTGPHETLSACSRALERIGRERGIPGKYHCMTGGGLPTFTPDARSKPKTARRPVAADNALEPL